MSKRASEAEHPTKVDWKIPLRGKLGEWYPVVRVGRHVPFGYKQDENDEDLLIPIPEELELLEKAKLNMPPKIMNDMHMICNLGNCHRIHSSS